MTNDATGSADPKVDSGRSKSARTSDSQHHKGRRAHFALKKMFPAPTKVHGKLSKSRDSDIMLSDFLADHRPIAASLH